MIKINKHQSILIVFYALLISVCIYTPWKNISSLIPEEKRTYLTNLTLFQRGFALMAFLMLSVQLFVGVFMDKLTQKFGGWIFKFHIWEGIIIYSLIVGHIMTYFLFLTLARGTFDPFYIFTDFCVLCETKDELFITLGRLSFWMITLAVLAAKFRALVELRKNWKYFHYLNYVVFVLTAIHAKFIGSDIMSPPYYYLYLISVGAGFSLILFKIALYIKSNFSLEQNKVANLP